jgi:hypothetical protein
MVDALFPKHVVVAPSGKGIEAILLPSGWDGDFQVDQDLHSIVMLNKVMKVINDVNKLPLNMAWMPAMCMWIPWSPARKKREGHEAPGSNYCGGYLKRFHYMVPSFQD